MKIVTPMNGKILLGRQGENLATKVIVPLHDVKEGEGSTVLIHQRSRDPAPYPLVIEENEDSVVWTVNSADVEFPGEGRAELRWMGENGEIIKSQIYSTYTIPSMSEPEEAPEAWKGYITLVVENAASAAASAQEATDQAGQAKQFSDTAVTAAENALASEQETKKSEQAASDSASAAQNSASEAKESEEAAGKILEQINEAVAKEADARQEADDQITESIDELKAKIGNLSNLMNWRGVVSSLDEVTDPQDGDVVAVSGKEYAYHDGTWEELGDTSAERADITALQERMDTAEADIDNAQTAADNAQTTADSAATAASKAQTAADNAQETADEALAYAQTLDATLEALIEAEIISPVGVDGAILTDDNGKIVVV